MQRILTISNRLPISIAKRKGKLHYSHSAGGLATGLSSFHQADKNLWIGWPGIITNNVLEKQEIEAKLKSDDMYPVFLTKNQIEKYYEGFSNKTIWPLFHYFSQYAVYEKKFWETYRHVNNIFCNKVIKYAKSDDIIWIHDYQLMLLPELIRSHLPDALIGFFLHIPFPSFELFRTLPWRSEILNGILGADLVGFHTYDYARHFISAVTRLLGIEHTFGKLSLEDRTIKVDSFPMGIDYDKFSNASKNPAIKNLVEKFLKKVGNQKVLLSVDRLDYSKAITQRLKAFNLFMEKNPDFHEKVTLILIVSPSRSRVKHYRELKEQVDELVGFINGKYGTIGWTPIWYLYRNFAFPMLSALYNVADVALITPYRDGMNLIAKEYIACKSDGKGVLILSEMAGSADELGDAIKINPNDVDDIERALHEALKMPADEQVRRNRQMKNKLKRYDIHRWTKDFVYSLQQIKEERTKKAKKRITPQARQKLINHYNSSERRLIFLDYDGTLVKFSNEPGKAIPDKELLDLLNNLAASPYNEVVIISGRNKATLQEWFGELNIGLVAEHGALLRNKGNEWMSIESLKQDWKKEIYPFFEHFVDRTPGSFIEKKEFSLVWHYRKADPELGELRARDLVDTLVHLTANLNLQVLEGNKVIEVKNSGINKGRAALQWINKENWDFIFALGDDWTDEDLFKVLPKDAYSIKVGFTSSAAKCNVKTVQEVRELLNGLIMEKTNNESVE